MSIQHYIKNISKSLSDQDIRTYLNDKTKIIRYSDLYNYSNIDHLLKPYDHVFILYMTKPTYGHWTLLFKRTPNEIQFFDSYGFIPDDEFKFVNDEFRVLSNQVHKKLVDMLYHSNYKITYNEYKLQGKDKARPVSTCGRWCIARWLFRHMTEHEFYEMFKRQGINMDLLVTMYINI